MKPWYKFNKEISIVFALLVGLITWNLIIELSTEIYKPYYCYDYGLFASACIKSIAIGSFILVLIPIITGIITYSLLKYKKKSEVKIETL